MHLSMTLINGTKLEYDLSSTKFTIGRSNRCDVVVPHEGVSRQHCQIEVVNGLMFVTDLGSTNGVVIDGEKIPPNVRTPCPPYLSIAFGSVQEMKVDLDAKQPVGARPTPAHQGSETITMQIELEDPADKRKQKKKEKEEKEKKKAKQQEDSDSGPGGLNATNLIFAVVLIGAIYWYMSSK